MAPQNERVDLSDNLTTRTVAGLAWPIIVSMLSHTAMGVADTLFVGQLGTAPLAGIGLAVSAGYLFQSFALGLLAGLKVAISQRIGALQEAAARRLAWQGLWMAGVFGAAVASCTFLAPALFGWMSDSAAVAGEAQAYLSISLLASPLQFATLAMNGWFHGRGQMRLPMVAAVLGNAVNIALNPLLIFGLGPLPALGISGSALATAVGHAAAALFLAWQIAPDLRGSDSRPARAPLAEAGRIGGPIGMRYLLDIASFSLFAAMLARAGEEQLAAHVIVIRIISVSFLPGYAFSEAASVLAGQAVGARRPERARQAWRLTVRLAVGVMAVGGAVFALAPGPLVAPFDPAPAVAEVAARLMLIAAIFQIFDAIAMAAFGALNGAGDTRFTMWVSLSAAWLIKLPLGWALAFPLGLGAAGAWIGLTAEIMAVAAAGWWRVRGDAWLRHEAAGADAETAADAETDAEIDADRDQDTDAA